ncbi:hypothetical protein [Salegentibacter sediminis]|uniref:hypothetical protein n=1 Tax=Salegentibacter sediminis TaxID=1930251 RepID=UPI0009BE7F70|nr:hypothetical protein [Salegentibacter sediminis]
MKKFLNKILIFSIILFVFNLVLGFILPIRTYYGNEMFEQKFSSIKNDLNDYNLYFFGSSRIVNGINPKVFDSVMQVNDRDINSYNLGSYGTWFNENIFLINSILNDTSIKDATFMIEFQQVMSVPWEKIDNHKNIYYQSSDNFTFILNYVLDKDIRTFRDFLIGVHYIFSYSISETLNIFNLGKLKGLESYSHSKESKKFDNKGFFAIDSRKEMNQITISNYQSKGVQLFQANESKSNGAFEKKINEIIKKAQERNISIIFILTPKNYTKEMVANYKTLPSENKIDYEKFLDQTSLFEAANWGDHTHFNFQGAQYFTEFVAKEFLILNRNEASENK